MVVATVIPVSSIRNSRLTCTSHTFYQIRGIVKVELENVLWYRIGSISFLNFKLRNCSDSFNWGGVKAPEIQFDLILLYSYMLYRNNCDISGYNLLELFTTGFFNTIIVDI